MESEAATQVLHPCSQHVVTIACSSVLGPNFVLSGIGCAWPISTYSILYVVIRINMAVSMLPSRHVRRAMYIQLSFYHVLWSLVLWRPLCSELNIARLRVRTALPLTDVILCTRSTTRFMIEGASSIEEGPCQAE